MRKPGFDSEQVAANLDDALGAGGQNCLIAARPLDP